MVTDDKVISGGRVVAIEIKKSHDHFQHVINQSDVIWLVLIKRNVL